MRLRDDAGYELGELPAGPHNAITDVPGVRVGHTTIVRGNGLLVVGHGPVRTGVTVIAAGQEPAWRRPRFAAVHRLNGNAELTGLLAVKETGLLTSPIALTNTRSVGVVRDELAAVEAEERDGESLFWSLPLVAETWDGLLNDINGAHITPGHVRDALAGCTAGPPAEGNVGGGTGMICHGFKGGIGTSSRLAATGGAQFAVGVLVQANHGRRDRLSVGGVAVGKQIPASVVPLPEVPGEIGTAEASGAGSIVAVVATDAPLLPHQLERLASRSMLGVAISGGTGEHFSGDVAIAFSVANPRLVAPALGGKGPSVVPLEMLSDQYISPLYEAVIEATQEAIVNALTSAETMTGRDGVTATAVPTALLVEILQRKGTLSAPATANGQGAKT